MMQAVFGRPLQVVALICCAFLRSCRYLAPAFQNHTLRRSVLGPEKGSEVPRLIVSVAAERLKGSKPIRELGAKVPDLRHLRALSLKLLPEQAEVVERGFLHSV